ncbi:MAG: hypothetical protein GQ547_08180 [Methylophaga sp.]|nr:hypothetical protein [Methylophaga sp.]
MTELQLQQCRQLPNNDYHWYLDDKSWADASHFQVRNDHLNMLKRGLCLRWDNWVDLLKSPDRLETLLRLATPTGDLFLCEDGPFSWHDLHDEFWGIGSYFWPDPTPFELQIRERVKANDELWISLGCYDNCDEQSRDLLLQIYEEIIVDVQQHEEKDDKRYFRAIDYRLFDCDEEWIDGSEGKICELYLDTLKQAVGVDDWVSFLKHPDRLQRILSSGSPQKNISELSILEGGVYQWRDLFSPAWGVYSMLWPHVIGNESEMLCKVKMLCKSWDSVGGELAKYQNLQQGIIENMNEISHHARRILK